MGDGFAHHQHQLSRIRAEMGERFAHHQHQPARVWAERPRVCASSASAGSCVAEAAEGVRIISISCLVCGLKRPSARTSSASAGLLCGLSHQGRGHHQHQLAHVWAEMGERFAHHHETAEACLCGLRRQRLVCVG